MIDLPILNTGEKYKLKPGKIVALGLNYSDHVKESVTVLASGKAPEDPAEPVIFPKAPSAIIGDGDRIVYSGLCERL